MSRKNRHQSSNSNPATKWIAWSSNDKCFRYYDKDKSVNVLIELPVKFLALVSYKTVKGYNQKKKARINANEIRSVAKTSDEILEVTFMKKDQDNEVLAKGKWADIKEKVDLYDGKFTESVYAMLPDGSVVNFALNGACLKTWYDFQKNQGDRLFDNWVEAKTFESGKTGSVDYTYPIFTFGQSLDRSEGKLAEKADAQIEAYENTYFGGKAPLPELESAVDKHDNSKIEDLDI